MNIEETVMNFISGSEKQRLWADALRAKYVAELLQEYSSEQVKILVIARPTAKWWIDNREKLVLANGARFIKAAVKAINKASTVEEYLDRQILIEAEKAKKLEDYYRERLKKETLWEEECYLEEVFEDRERPW